MQEKSTPEGLKRTQLEKRIPKGGGNYILNLGNEKAN